MSIYTQARALLLAAAGLSWATTASAVTRCVNPAGSGGCYPVIQSAVNAALPGDTILIQAGTYHQIVTVPAEKAGLKIIGVSKTAVILDPGAPVTGTGITIRAPRAQVTNLTVQNGDAWGIEVHADDVVVRGVRVIGTVGGIYDGGAWNTQILANEIRAVAGIGVATGSTGFGAIIQGNTITQAGTLGIDVRGDAPRIVGNSVRLTGGVGINVSADGALVSANDVRYSASAAIFLAGRDPVAQRNSVSSCTYGLQVTCVDCYAGLVLANTVTSVFFSGIVIASDGPGLVVQGNTISKVNWSGVSLNGTGAQLKANRVADVGDYGLSIFGRGNTVAGNTVVNSSLAGFYVSGDSNTLTSNVATKSQHDGFTVFSGTGNVLTSNQAGTVATQGFAVRAGASNTVLTSNRASKNWLDFCNEGTGTSSVGNVFATTATTGPF